jgi:hypothetical protein
MSSPQTHQKTNNFNLINKIKLSQKWFLVMVNPVQLKERDRKAPAPAGAFPYQAQATPVSRLLARI